MTRLFLRLHLVIILSMVVVGAGVGVFVMSTVVPERNAQLSRWLDLPLSTLSVQLQGATPERREEIIRDYEAHTGAAINIKAISETSCLDAPARDRLSNGEVVLNGSYFAYVGLDEHHAIQVNLYPDRPFHWLPFLALAISLSLTGLGVWFVIRPLQRRLTLLSQTADDFGHGQLDSRTKLHGAGPIEHLGSRFDAMADQVQGLIESKEELLRAVSHELRTPLSRLFFATGLIEGAESEEERTELVESMQETLEEMRSLTSELLTFTRLSEGTPDVERTPVDLQRLANDAARQLAPSACSNSAHKTVQINPASIPTEVLGDAMLLQRALRNLLSNARRHAKNRVELSIERNADDLLVVHVDDDGCGIAEDERDRVLKPFVRLETSRCRNTGGTGLGLAIVDRVARRHDGHVLIETSPLGGARFSMILPGA